MRTVDNQWQRARSFLVSAACTSVVIGFVACGGSDAHQASRHDSAGGDASGGAAAGAPASPQAGHESSQGGEPNSAGQSAGGAGGVAGENAGGVGGDRGGEIAVSGQSMGGAAGDATAGVAGEAAGGSGGAGGEAVGGGGGAGGEAPFVDPVCGLNMVKVGEYSLWCGKVNEHTDGEGVWQPDADCTSGCNVTGVGYCQKFYPSTTTVVSVPQIGQKDWKNAGFISGQSGACNDSAPDSAGISGQAACCAPLP
jgi:hypothetical protein